MNRYSNHYEEIYVCEDCFIYSKYPEQWEKVTTDNYRKCASCGQIKNA